MSGGQLRGVQCECVGLSFEVFISHGLGRGRLWITQYWLRCVIWAHTAAQRPSLPLSWVWCYGVNWSPHLWNMRGVNITIDNVRDKKVKVSIVGPHSELTQPSGRSQCPGSTPGHWGGFYWGWDQYHNVIISNEGWGQSGAEWTRDVVPGKLIPHQLSAAILFHWQEE